MSGETVLALDVGTQSSRALLFDAGGKIVGRAQRSHQALHSPRPGVAEVDVEDIWQCLTACIRSCLQGQASPRAIGLASQRRVLVAVDAAGQPIGRAYSWLDTRKAATYPGSGMLGKLACKLSGVERLPGALVTYSQANLLFEHRPEDYARCARFLTLSGWLTRRLTGNDCDACGSIVGAWPYDVKGSRWHSTDLIQRMAGTSLERLPRLVASGTELGRIEAPLADELGLPPAIPLIAVGGDKQAEVLGAGVTAAVPELAEVSLGTGVSLSVVRPWARPSLGFQWLTTNAAEPRAFCHEFLLPRGFWMWTWYLEQLGAADVAAAAEAGQTPEAWLAEAIEAIPPGSDGLIALPRWSPGADSPYSAGALVGFSEMHTRHHIARALVEGICFDLRRGLARLEQQFGPISGLRVGGGGARSPVVLRTVCDVLERPLQVPIDVELTARGVAMVTALACGLVPHLAAAEKAFVHLGETLTPRPDRVRVYRQIYQDRYLPALQANRGLAWWKTS